MFVAVTVAEQRSVAVFRWIRSSIAKWIQIGADFLERHSWILFPLILLAFVPKILLQSRGRPLWHDELFTYYISQAPDLATLVHQTRTLDLNPPLSFLLVRGALHAFHPSATVCRLPYMLGFILCMGCLYSFVSKKVGPLWGMAAALLLASGVAFPYALEARPYGLLLGFTALGFLGWQKATTPGENRALDFAFLLVGGFGALLSHVFAIFAWCMLILAEAVRVYLSRRLDWKVVLALLLPLVAVVTYIPLIRVHGASYYPAEFQPDLYKLLKHYLELFRASEVVIAFTVILALLILGRSVFGVNGKLRLNAAELTALLGFLAIPAILVVYLMRSHAAFFPRYGIIAEFAAAALVPIFVAWLTRESRSVALIASAFLYAALFFSSGISHVVRQPSLLSFQNPPPDPCKACEIADRLAPNLPFVTASGLTFLEIDNRESFPFLSRVFYLTDPEAAFKFAHANIYEAMQSEKDNFPIRANVAKYSDFVSQHPEFLVFGFYDHPEDWLLRKLQSDGATLTFLGTVDDNQFMDSVLWKVSMPGATQNDATRPPKLPE
jgi:hypothetical protein